MSSTKKHNRKLRVRKSFLEFKDSLQKYKLQILVAIPFLFLTVIFFWPMATNLSSYSEGGDHMFNAWTLSRNHHCILRQNCNDYTNANIFFPNRDSMLYSETQLSAGILTLPLYFVNPNPLFATNIWYILSMFFSGFFMYLLALYLSKGNQPISILAGLVFEFAPTKINFCITFTKSKHFLYTTYHTIDAQV